MYTIGRAFAFKTLLSLSSGTLSKRHGYSDKSPFFIAETGTLIPKDSISEVTIS
jgi:hypothetical protein